MTKPTPKPKKPSAERGATHNEGGDTPMFGKGTRINEGNSGNETSSVRICRRDGVDHPSGHDVGGGCAPQVSDLPASTYAFGLRAPTCASMCSCSVCWVWCS